MFTMFETKINSILHFTIILIILVWNDTNFKKNHNTSSPSEEETTVFKIL